MSPAAHQNPLPKCASAFLAADHPSTRVQSRETPERTMHAPLCDKSLPDEENSRTCRMPDCGQRFVPKREWQDFCSETCRRAFSVLKGELGGKLLDAAQGGHAAAAEMIRILQGDEGQ